MFVIYILRTVYWSFAYLLYKVIFLKNKKKSNRLFLPILFKVLIHQFFENICHENNLY